MPFTCFILKFYIAIKLLTKQSLPKQSNMVDELFGIT